MANSREVHPDRVRRLNERPDRGGRYILYWMQQSQRTKFNHALEFAAEQANAANLPLLVAFGLMDDYPEANLRHYRFMLEGLAEIGPALERRGMAFVVQQGSPDSVALQLADDAALVVCDRGYLRHQKTWRNAVAKQAGCPVFQIESDVVVPVETTSGKAEYAARTIRPKILRLRDEFLHPVVTVKLKRDGLDLRIEGLDVSDPIAACDGLSLDRTIEPVSQFFRGGETAAHAVWNRFLSNSFDEYADHRNQPQTSDVSHMSKYLHFGQISPLELVLLARQRKVASENLESFLEEVIVRRELAMNFVYHTPAYDQYDCLPDWARKTLDEHSGDERPQTYSESQLEAAETHDAYWNAAMREMRFTGYMHNAMRMYWGKKILHWTRSPQEAHRITMHLNNKYFLDGRDANSYTNVNWVFGLHDRPWGERDVFGKVRCMMASGLERKCDIDAYVVKVDKLVSQKGQS